MLTDLHVQALIAAAKSREMIKRAWLIDAMTITNAHDVEFKYTNPVVIGTTIGLTKAESNASADRQYKSGEIVGVNGTHAGVILEDSDGSDDSVLVAVLSDNQHTMFHRLDVFAPSKYLAEFKEALGTNNCTKSFQTCGKTTVGRFIENLIVLQYPTDFTYFPYVNEPWGDKKILKLATDAAYNKKITVEQYKRFVDNFFYLNHITEISVPSMTERSLMTNPKVAEFKKKFIEEHKDQMNDPLVIKQLEDALIALDKEWLGKGTDEEDPSVTFIDGLGSKTWALHRKKLFLTTGGIPAFDASSGKFDFIENSLSEGWTIPALPSIANEIRKGSYERGKETAKGGAETKLVMRVFQDLMVDNDDCGTTRTTKFDFKDTCRIKDFIGRTIRWGGQDVVITEENYKQFDGKVLDVYSPMTCATPYNLCYKCCGQRAKTLGAKVIGIQVVKITSKFMNTAMKNMHGTVLQVVQPKLENIFL